MPTAILPKMEDYSCRLDIAGIMVCEHLHFFGVVEGFRHQPCPPPPARSRAARVEETHDFFAFLFDRLGLSANAYRGSALNRRAPACLRFLHVRNLEAGRRKLQNRPELIPATASVVLLGVTDFCRDQIVFDQLREVAVPHLGRLGRPPRVWSAACSDGRELYSVAILFEEAGLLKEAELLGTDCRADAIEQARGGCYPACAIEKLEGLWRRHFLRHHQTVRAREELRRAIRWKQADLLREAERGPWDLILWRNMAIYLEMQPAVQTWNAIIAELAPGGWLVAGKADHPPRTQRLEKIGACIYQKPADP